jgi:hypothetical protein
LEGDCDIYVNNREKVWKDKKRDNK